jgi:hypothetical protein
MRFAGQAITPAQAQEPAVIPNTRKEGIAFSAPYTPVKQYEDGKYRPYVPQRGRA